MEKERRSRTTLLIRRMNAVQMLFSAMPESSSRTPDSCPRFHEAPATMTSTTAAPAIAPTHDGGKTQKAVQVESECEYRAECGACRNAERIGRGERVAQHGLKQTSGERQSAAGQQAQAESAKLEVQRRSDSRARPSPVRGPS